MAAVPDPDTFVDFLATIAKPPLDRLESITERLEKTGEVTEETVGELRYLVGMISSSETGVDAQSARNLAVAAEILSSVNIKQSASWLLTVSDTLPKVVARLEAAVRQLPPQ